MFKALCTRSYQKIRGKVKKNPVKCIKIFLKKKKRKRENMVVNAIRISQKLQNKG